MVQTPVPCMQGYKPPNVAASEYQTIPMNKIEDFGVHANQYYPLDVSFFKSSLDSHMLDMLWNKCAFCWAPNELLILTSGIDMA